MRITRGSRIGRTGHGDAIGRGVVRVEGPVVLVVLVVRVDPAGRVEHAVAVRARGEVLRGIAGQGPVVRRVPTGVRAPVAIAAHVLAVSAARVRVDRWGAAMIVAVAGLRIVERGTRISITSSRPL